MDYPYPIKIRAVWWNEENKQVCWINTLKIPFEEEIKCTDDPNILAKAIVEMEIRGAPAIGVATALGIAAYAHKIKNCETAVFRTKILNAIDILWNTRPTAVNLFWALKRMKNMLEESIKTGDPMKAAIDLEKEAIAIMDEDIRANIKMGEYGAGLIPDGATILTHCNAGALATAAFGTAEGIMRVAWYKGKKIKVVATETRPVLQGARLTVWELVKEGIPVTLITDNMAGYVIRKGLVDLVIVGADRITREGYVINKIGTYMIALAAKRKGIPFYVAAPTSTIDLESSINDVVIEERNPDEVRRILGRLITVPDVPALNYAFDITDPDLVTAIITEKGVVRPPYEENLKRLLASK